MTYSRIDHVSDYSQGHTGILGVIKEDVNIVGQLLNYAKKKCTNNKELDV